MKFSNELTEEDHLHKDLMVALKVRGVINCVST